MKLTKTQRTLLLRAIKERADGTGTICIQTGFYTCRKNSRYGGRDHDAVIKMRDAGLVELYRTDSGRDCKSGGYSTHHWNGSEWKLTEAGKQLAQQLIAEEGR